METLYDLVPSPRFLQGFIVNRGQAAGLDGCVFRAKDTADRGRDCISILKLSVSRNGCPPGEYNQSFKNSSCCRTARLRNAICAARQPSRAKRSRAEKLSCRYRGLPSE